MEGQLGLKCSLYEDEKIIKLSLKRPTFKSVNLDTDFVIFEDAVYTATLYLTDLQSEINNVTVFLNGNVIGSDRKIEKKSDVIKCLIRFNSKNTEFPQPFLLQCDLIEISLKITLKDDYDLELFAPFLLCVSKNVDDAENAEEIVSTLLNFDDDNINRWIFLKKSINNSQTGLIEGGFRDKSYKSILSYLQLLNDIIQCYQNNYVYFKAQAKHSIISNAELKEYAKVRSFDNRSIKWLCKNLEQLSTVENRSAIMWNNQYYLPYKVMSEQKKVNYDIYENRMIISFLKEVIIDAEQIQRELKSMLIEEENVFQKLKRISFEHYHAPIITIKNVQIMHNKEILQRISMIIDSARHLLHAYITILPCQSGRLVGMPKKTKIFQEIRPYRFVYELIVKWYRYGEASLEKDNILFQVKTMDKLYEYYCLIQLLKMLKEEGYEIKDEKNDIDLFEYKTVDGKYENERDVANTYNLCKDSSHITLYYQPVIYADGYANGLTLYRTTSYNSYYSPDFVIKITQNQESSYVILDAKYSSKDNIKKYALENCILKYGVEVESYEENCEVKMMWILQGRVDGTNAMYRYHISPNSAKAKKQLKSYGIVSLNTKINILKRLWNEILNSVEKDSKIKSC